MNKEASEVSITLEQLESKDACREQVELFSKMFGSSVSFKTKEEAVKVAVKVFDKFNFNWATDNLLNSNNRKAYWEATAPLWKAYMEAKAPLGEAYMEAEALLWKAYEEAKAPLWKAYREAKTPLLKAYEEARAPLWEAYREARSPLWKAYEEAKAPLLKAYEEAVASPRKACMEAKARIFAEIYFEQENSNDPL